MYFEIEGQIIYCISLCEKYKTNDQIRYFFTNTKCNDKFANNTHLYESNFVGDHYDIIIDIEFDMNNYEFDMLMLCEIGIDCLTFSADGNFIVNQ